MQLLALHLIIISGFAFSNLSLDTRNQYSSGIDSVSVFLDSFERISFDTLHVYTPCKKPDGKKFAGRIMDSAFHNWFELSKYQLSNLRWQNMFSCYKFELNDSLTALIVRRPSQYSETAITLNLWDNKKEKIVSTTEIADSYGDGMWYFVKDAWLLDINGDLQLDIVTRTMHWTEEDIDPTPDNPLGRGEVFISDTVIVFIGNKESFELSNLKIDTAQFRLLNWDN